MIPPTREQERGFHLSQWGSMLWSFTRASFLTGVIYTMYINSHLIFFFNLGKVLSNFVLDILALIRVPYICLFYFCKVHNIYSEFHGKRMLYWQHCESGGTWKRWRRGILMLLSQQVEGLLWFSLILPPSTCLLWANSSETGILTDLAWVKISKKLQWSVGVCFWRPSFPSDIFSL